MSADTSTGITDAIVKSRGSLASPTVLTDNDRIYEKDYYGHDGTGYIQTMGSHVYHDSDVSGISANVLPMAYEYYTKTNGVSNVGFDMSIVKFKADRTIVFNDNGTRHFGDGVGNANITQDGTINTVAGINATGNVDAAGFTGSGGGLTDIDSFGTIVVSGQTSVSAGAVSSNLTLAAAGAIEITTDAANGTVTIGGTGGSYGNTDVENFMSSGAYEANLEMTGNVNINPNIANVVTASGNISGYFGNVNTGSNDQFQMNGTAADPGWADGTAITFGNTTNPNLTFLNGNVYYTKDIDGAGTVYEIYTDSGLTTPLQSGLGSESPTGLTAEYVASFDVDLEITGDLKSSNALFTNSIQSYTDGGTIQCQSLRVEDFSVTQPFGINVVANSSLNSGPYVNPFQGSLVHVTGDRYGADGAPAYWNGNNWKYVSDDANVTI
jgi:hypothetical protein